MLYLASVNDTHSHLSSSAAGGQRLQPTNRRSSEEGKLKNRDGGYFVVFSVLRGRPYGKAPNLLPNNFSSLFIKLSLPHEGLMRSSLVS